LIKVSSKWFDFSSYGMIIGILSISYLVGDAAARQWMGMLIQHGYGWRALFYFAAAVVGVFLLLNFLFLRESRSKQASARPNPIRSTCSRNRNPAPKAWRNCCGPCSAAARSSWFASYPWAAR